MLPALVVRKLKEFRYYFAFFPAAHTQLSHTHTHTHLLAALWCKLCRRSENKCCICMRHDMSQVLSTPHPHATLSPQLPSLPRTTYPIPLTSRHIERSLAGCGLPLGLTSLSVWKWRCESVKVICKVDVAVAVPAAVAASLPGALPVGGFCLLLWQLIMRRLSM